jgi:hypothetical protein
MARCWTARVTTSRAYVAKAIPSMKGRRRMSHSKLGLKVLVPCLLAVLSAMALTAAGAQAKGHWFVNLALLTKTIRVGALEPIDGLLLSTFGAGNTAIEILCSKVLVHDGLLFSDGSSLGEILFSKCATYLKKEGTPTDICKPLEPILAKVKNLLIHHSNDTYILFSAHSGLVLVILHLGDLCPAGEEIVVSGHAVAECGLLLEGLWHHEDCSNEKVEHEIRQAPDGLFSASDKLSYGIRAASLHGDGKLVLDGEHVGQKWGALAIL